MSITYYAGPSGVIFTPDELLTLWAELTRHPTPENQPMRDKIKTWLESRSLNGNGVTENIPNI